MIVDQFLVQKALRLEQAIKRDLDYSEFRKIFIDYWTFNEGFIGAQASFEMVWANAKGEPKKLKDLLYLNTIFAWLSFKNTISFEEVERIRPQDPWFYLDSIDFWRLPQLQGLPVFLPFSNPKNFGKSVYDGVLVGLFSKTNIENFLVVAFLDMQRQLHYRVLSLQENRPSFSELDTKSSEDQSWINLLNTSTQNDESFDTVSQTEMDFIFNRLLPVLRFLGSGESDSTIWKNQSKELINQVKNSHSKTLYIWDFDCQKFIDGQSTNYSLSDLELTQEIREKVFRNQNDSILMNQEIVITCLDLLNQFTFKIEKHLPEYMPYFREFLSLKKELTAPEAENDLLEISQSKLIKLYSFFSFWEELRPPQNTKIKIYKELRKLKLALGNLLNIPSVSKEHFVLKDLDFIISKGIEYWANNSTECKKVLLLPQIHAQITTENFLAIYEGLIEYRCFLLKQSDCESLEIYDEITNDLIRAWTYCSFCPLDSSTSILHLNTYLALVRHYRLAEICTEFTTKFKLTDKFHIGFKTILLSRDPDLSMYQSFLKDQNLNSLN